MVCLRLLLPLNLGLWGFQYVPFFLNFSFYLYVIMCTNNYMNLCSKGMLLLILRHYKCRCQLDQSLNTLSGPLSAISYLGSCSSLKNLNLSSNFLDFSSREFGGLKLSLEVLDLSNNKIVGANVVPWILFNGCDELKQLTLKGNKVRGDVNVSKCKNLQFLDVSSNNISMAVPSFGDCLALEYLDISANKFVGDIGHAISGCKHLSFLNVSSNLFAGPIPIISSASNMQYLILGENKFQGEIPLHLADLCTSLVQLDLSSNNLSGKVPSSFSSCSLLESFDISSNNFTGELPIYIFLSMSNLKQLVLSFNDFTGASRMAGSGHFLKIEEL